MQNKYTTLNDVKKFMKTELGQTWQGGVYCDEKYFDIETFNQLCAIGACSPLFSTFDSDEFDPTLYKISTTKFQKISRVMNDFGDRYEYDIVADYSKVWMRYQCDIYGDQMKSLCLEEIEAERLDASKEFDIEKAGLIRKMIHLEQEAEQTNARYAMLKSEISTIGLKK